MKITERGWAGHFILGNMCKFRRNTLIEHNDRKIIVSTVGNLVIDGKEDGVGCDRDYETMAFEAINEGKYIEVDVEKEISIESEWQLKRTKENEDNIDNLANEMHEAAVKEICEKMNDDSDDLR